MTIVLLLFMGVGPGDDWCSGEKVMVMTQFNIKINSTVGSSYGNDDKLPFVDNNYDNDYDDYSCNGTSATDNRQTILILEKVINSKDNENKRQKRLENVKIEKKR